MLDIQLLRSNLALVAERLATRGVTLDTVGFETLEAERKRLQVQTQDLQAKRNTLSKQIGMLKGKGEDASAVMAEVAGLGDALKAGEAALAELMPRFDTFLESRGCTGRWASSCSTCTPASTATPRSMFPTSHRPPRCAAPASCRNSKQTCLRCAASRTTT
jgi:uncharacterized protein YoxC